MYVTAENVLSPTERRFLLSMKVSAGFCSHASMWKNAAVIYQSRCVIEKTMRTLHFLEVRKG